MHRKPKNKKGAQTPRILLSKEKGLIRLDTNVIRAKALKMFQQAHIALKKDEAQWQRHINEEAPAFANWMRLNVGPLLSRMQDLARQVEYEGMLVDLCIMEHMVTGESRRDCFEKIKQNLELANDQEAEDTREDDQDFDIPFGDDDDFFGEPHPDQQFRFDFQPDKESSVSRQIKDTYRELIRRLHPDLNPTLSPQQQERWHQVQQAYEARDLDRLKVLLTHEQLNSGEISNATTVSHILSLTAHFHEARNAIRRMIRTAMKQPAWGFLTWSDSTKAARLKGIKKALEWDLMNLKRHAKELRKELERWRSAPKPKSKSKPKKRKKPVPSNPFDDDHVPF